MKYNPVFLSFPLRQRRIWSAEAADFVTVTEHIFFPIANWHGWVNDPNGTWFSAN